MSRIQECLLKTILPKRSLTLQTARVHTTNQRRHYITTYTKDFIRMKRFTTELLQEIINVIAYKKRYR